jgi:peptide chain release factor 1
MKPSMLAKLDQLANRLVELDELLTHEGATANMDNYRKMTREHAELGPLVAVYRQYQPAEGDIAAAQEMLADPDMKDFAQDEIERPRRAWPRSTSSCRRCCCRRTKTTSATSSSRSAPAPAATNRRCSPATCCACTRALPNATAGRSRWCRSRPSDLGGYREVIVRVAGNGVYSKLKFESGGHRVQRVPATETQGRIHTSACTVAVMPEADEVEDVNINPADLRIDTYRASGAGGQHINKTDSAVRLTHLPTGIVVECQDDRSQHKNKAQAMKVLAARIKDVQLREQQAKEAATRKSLIGSGDRSERIRTYNFPQGRLTDHRINLTLYKLDFIMDGDLTELTGALAAEHQAELLAALGD